VKVFSSPINILQKAESKKGPNNIQKMFAGLKLLQLAGKKKQERKKLRWWRVETYITRNSFLWCFY